jgi:hypothetical protein
MRKHADSRQTERPACLRMEALSFMHVAAAWPDSHPASGNEAAEYLI